MMLTHALVLGEILKIQAQLAFNFIFVHDYALCSSSVVAVYIQSADPCAAVPSFCHLHYQETE